MTRTVSPLSFVNPFLDSAPVARLRGLSMSRIVRLACVALLPLTVACGESPTSPSPSSVTPTATPTPSSTRVISVTGNLAFGDVPVGSQRTMTYTVSNSGTSPLTITGTTISGGLASQTVFGWTNGQIAPGGSQVVSVRFQPTTAGSYNGTISVNGDQTGGSNVVAISGNAAGATVSGTWAGQYIVERCDGTGSNQDYFCGATNGAYPAGTSLPISLALTQSGSSVSGTMTLGRVSGVVNGSISPNGALVLQGTATAGTVSVQLSSWNTSVNGASMQGSFTYNASLSTVPGVAVVTSRFSGVTRR